MASVRRLDDDPVLASPDEVQKMLREVARLEAWVAQRRAEWVRALDEKCAYVANGAKSPAGWLASEAGMSPTEAAREVKRAAALHLLPHTDDALRTGKISTGHVEHLAKLADDETLVDALARDECELLDGASRQSVEQFRRKLARWKLSQRDDDGGMDAAAQHEKRSGKKISDDDGLEGIRALWPAEQSEEFWSILDRFLNQRWNGIHSREPSAKDLKRPQLVADALLDMARVAGGRDRDKLRLPQSSVRVVIDFQTLLNQVHEHTVCELDDGTTLSPETVRRLACNARILPMVLDGRSQILDYGRARHLASPAQVDALRVRDGGCFMNHCDAHVSWCEAHHIEWWRHEGQTDLDNLVLACPKHHHMIHEGGWTLRRGSDGALHVASPTGVVIQRGYSQARQRRPHPTDEAASKSAHPDNDRGRRGETNGRSWRVDSDGHQQAARTGRGQKSDHGHSSDSPPRPRPEPAPRSSPANGRKSDQPEAETTVRTSESDAARSAAHPRPTTNPWTSDDGSKSDQPESEAQRKDRKFRSMGIIMTIDPDGSIKRPGCWEAPAAT